MSNSPKDNQPEDEGASDPTKADGTLNAFPDSDASVEPTPSSAPEEESPGTAGTLDSDIPLTPSASDNAAHSETMLQVEDSGEERTQPGTLSLPEGGPQGKAVASDDADSRTIIFDESGILPDKGSVAHAQTDSSEKLRRVWDAAVGSSGKESGQSLSYERPEASDSVLGRVAIRSVTDANAAQAADADYQIQDKLGVGGMGVVFSAIQTAVNRKVALKTLKAEKSKDTSARKQFFYEAEITADLDHPNIPPIYEFGATRDDVCFYTMKLIRGAEWDRILSKKTQEENLEIFNDVADAIAFAHSKNIIHRDIKPDNVIVGAFGEVYVTDWGLAVNLSRTPDKSQIRFGGTPEYMAPEMGMARGDLIDKGCDIYLLGAVLFQIITSKRPRSFKAKASVGERVKAVISNQIVETAVEDPLLEVALKAMSTRPEDRYRTVEDLQGAVREIQRKNTNIKSSIDLTKRSKDEARLAMSGKDYDRFNRAIFGFRDAVELWDGNKEADEELKKVRLAHGQCAFDRGDYDLAIQTLDSKIPEESTLLGKAEKARQAVLQREQRFKTLRNVFMASVASLSVLLAGAAIYANKARAAAESARKIARDAEIAAVSAKNDAVSAKQDAEEARDAEQEQKDLAERNARDAQFQARVAISQERDARYQSKRAVAAKRDADEQRELAVTNAEREREQRLRAELNFAKAELGQQLTKLGFANAQVDQSNPIGAASLLDQIKGVDMTATLQERTPKLWNWATNRVALLSNADLEKMELAGTVTALAFAHGKNVGVAGMDDGTVRRLRLERGRLIEASKKTIGSRVQAAAISPAGDEAILAINVAGENAKPQYQLFRWGLEGEVEPMREEVTGNRFFQGFGYNPDGSAVVAGIRGGVWARIRGGEWKVLADRVKGELLDLAWIDNESLLVLSSQSGTHHLYVIRQSLGDAPSSGLVDLSTAIDSSIDGQVTAIGRAGPRVVVGTDRGILSTLDLIMADSEDGKFKAKLANRVDLPKRHRRPIIQIESDGAGRMVTGSIEPTAHAWRVASNGGVEYDTFLSGSPGESSEENNIQQLVFADSKQVVNVDSKGVAVAIDIDRQKQRRQLTRISEQDDAPELYSQKVVGIHPRGLKPEAISVDANGVVDLWNLQTGRTRRLIGSQADGERFSYFGHTPGAQLVDTVVDVASGVVVTSARVPDSAQGYLANMDHNREYCVWDQATGAMLRRWSDRSASAEAPRLSLVASGLLLIGSDEGTKMVDFEGKDIPGLDALRKPAAAFAVVSPRNPEIVAMFKRAGGKGTGWIWNRRTGQWFVPRDNGVEFESNVPVQAVWSEDGQRMYVLDVGGRVTQLILAENVLKGALGGPVKLDVATNLLNALRSHQDADLAVQDVGGIDRLYVQIRDTRSQSPQTSLSTLDFGKDGLLQAPTTTIDSGLSWWNDIQGFEMPKARVLAKRRVGEEVFVSMRSGNVYGLSAASRTSTIFGRQRLIASTSDADGTFLLTLHEDGSILRLDLADPSQATWSKVPFAAPEASGFRLSPNGQELAIHDGGRNALRIVNAVDGTELRGYQDVSPMGWGWDPKQPASIAYVGADGRVLLEQAGAAMDLGTLPLGERTILGVHFFEEQWQDRNLAATPYVLVQAQDTDARRSKEGELWFVPRIRAEGEAKEAWKSSTIPRDVTIAVSPVDSILASGDSTGTIRIWFASPEFATLSPVYDLPSSGDSKIERIAFSGDGDTLITSDDKNRLYGWMSRDLLSVPGDPVPQ